jgi:hypothetical protein
MEIMVNLTEENSRRLLAVREMGIIDIDTDNICNDAIKDQLDKTEQVISDLASHFESR